MDIIGECVIENKKQTINKKRVRDFGEVFTNDREINGMIDLMGDKIKTIETTFLEPTCGDGNFLTAILLRKFKLIPKYKTGFEDSYFRDIVKAISTIYGVEIQADNAEMCRNNLISLIKSFLPKKINNNKYETIVTYIINNNIVVGDFLTMTNSQGEPIVFKEYKFISDWHLVITSWSLNELMNPSRILKFNNNSECLLPKLINSTKPIYFMEVGNE